MQSNAFDMTVKRAPLQRQYRFFKFFEHDKKAIVGTVSLTETTLTRK